MKIEILNFRQDTSHFPFRAHYNDAGADVYAPKSCIVKPHETVKLPLGFGLAIPDGFMGLVFPRSGLAAVGVTCELPPIDSGYRGEIHAIITNNSDVEYDIRKGDRVGQLVVLPIMIPDFEENLKSDRGTGAFASTGR